MPVTRKLMKLRVTSDPTSALSASASASPSTTPLSPALGSRPRSRCMSRKPKASSCQPTTTACVSSLTWRSVPSSPETPATPGTPAMALPSDAGKAPPKISTMPRWVTTRSTPRASRLVWLCSSMPPERPVSAMKLPTASATPSAVKTERPGRRPMLRTTRPSQVIACLAPPPCPRRSRHQRGAPAADSGQSAPRRA